MSQLPTRILHGFGIEAVISAHSKSDNRIASVHGPSPSYVDELEIIDLGGYWQDFEQWKRDLVSITAVRRGAGPSSVLWDFSGYDSYSTEPLPEGRGTMRWFIETNHFTRDLGQAIIARLSGRGDPHFGERLTVQNIEQHLAAIREHRQLYRQGHPDVTRRIHMLYGIVGAEYAHERAEAAGRVGVQSVQR